MMEVKSNVVKNNIALEPGMLGLRVKVNWMWSIKQDMARVNINILGISELKPTKNTTDKQAKTFNIIGHEGSANQTTELPLYNHQDGFNEKRTSVNEDENIGTCKMAIS